MIKYLILLIVAVISLTIGFGYYISYESEKNCIEYELIPTPVMAGKIVTIQYLPQCIQYDEESNS